MAAERIVGLLSGGAAERAAAYDELEEMARQGPAEGRAAVAVASVGPLCAVLGRESEEVGVEEFKRAVLVVYALLPLDLLRISGILARPTSPCVVSVLRAKTSVLGAVVAKDAAALTEEDAVVAIFAHGLMACQFCLSFDDLVPYVGQSMTDWSMTDWLGPHVETAFMYDHTVPDERNLSLVDMTWQLLTTPGKLPDAIRFGAHQLISHAQFGRPAVSRRLLDLGLLEHTVATLRQAPPMSWLTNEAACQAGFEGFLMHCVQELIDGCATDGLDLSQRLLSSGYVDCLVTALQTIEAAGRETSPETWHIVVLVFGLMRALAGGVDVGECAGAVIGKLRQSGSALRFLIDADFVLGRECGWTTGVFGSIVVANLFGRDEESEFGFRQADVDGMLKHYDELLRPKVYGSVWALSMTQCRGLLNVCVSDTNKLLLLNNETFLPHVVDGLLLDPAHPRADTPEPVKQVVQRDYAECLQQLALFVPGCAALQADDAVLNALHGLADSGFTEEAKKIARLTLMSLESSLSTASQQHEHHESDSTTVPKKNHAQRRHIMVSYQWNSQAVVQRIVAELKRRKYTCWFDLDDMSGSIIDAMGEAIEGAECMLLCLSLAYKESASK
eukprot:COSAG02_NODE_5334_length_4430_cov_2.102517_1_plen_616_part_00